LGNLPSLGRRVLVIGGGNVAYDVGRTVLRQIAMDAARTALRGSGVSEVYLCSLESLGEMPAEDVEIIEGDEEGIRRRNSLGPVEVLKDPSGGVRGIVFQRCVRVFDENRRFAPLFDESTRETIPCDNVLLSIGQGVDLINDARERARRIHAASPATRRQADGARCLLPAICRAAAITRRIKAGRARFISLTGRRSHRDVERTSGSATTRAAQYRSMGA
jgi:NADPH-dependent glutamate synthase beta subunit-like oxidoreductase